MPNQLIALLVALLLTLIGACTTPASTPDDDFLRFATQVETEIRLAEKTGFLWRDTDRILREAREAQKAGRHDDAMKLANQALKQAQLAQQQARLGANAAPAFPSQ
jgi:hypothetical protein